MLRKTAKNTRTVATTSYDLAYSNQFGLIPHMFTNNLTALLPLDQPIFSSTLWICGNLLKALVFGLNLM